MHRKFSIIALAVLISGLVIVPGFSAIQGSDAKTIGCANDTAAMYEDGDFDAQLKLYRKDPGTWTVIPKNTGAAFGNLEYTSCGPAFRFNFNGHKLVPGQEYSLVYYPDPWPGEGLVVLGSGEANAGGEVHIKGSPETGELPAAGDENFPNGAKIWLVLKGDVEPAAMRMADWHPEQYLFEYALISYSPDCAVADMCDDGVFSAALSGLSEVPEVATTASGEAAFTLADGGEKIFYVLQISGMSTLISAHLHLAGAGTNGPAIAEIYPADALSCESDGTVIAGDITAVDLQIPGYTMADLADDLAVGGVYVNVHSEQWPAGEVRGQVQCGLDDWGVFLESVKSCLAECAGPVE